MIEKNLIINVGKSFLQRSYMWSILFLLFLSTTVIFFEFPKSLDPFVFIFYVLLSIFLLKLIFLHGLVYRLDSKMLFVEHRFIPWQRNALWRHLVDIKYTEIFKNRFYPNGYFHVVLYFKHDDFENVIKIYLSNGLYHFKDALAYIREVIAEQEIELSDQALENINTLMELCDEDES